MFVAILLTAIWPTGLFTKYALPSGQNTSIAGQSDCGVGVIASASTSSVSDEVVGLFFPSQLSKRMRRTFSRLFCSEVGSLVNFALFFSSSLSSSSLSSSLSSKLPPEGV